MQIRPQDQNLHFDQVGIMQNENQMLQQQQRAEYKLSVEEAIATLPPIPDEIKFNHDFRFLDKCYEKQEESIFNIESIGELRLGGHIETTCKNGKSRPCSCKDCLQCCNKIPCCTCQCCSCCNEFEAMHYYLIPCYILQNDKLRFENYDSFSKLYIQDTLILEFIHSHRNWADSYCGSCKSNYPHIYFTNPIHEKNKKILFEPLGNKCPKNTKSAIGCCCICSWCGINQLERNIVAKVEDYGSAKIIARRSYKNACLSQCDCQDYCCHFIDYPDFEMKFQNLSNLDKLGLIMATISYTIYNRWAKYSYRGLFGLNTSYINF
ncbi:unnamed protein product [Paramecium sonneborni]|uniref:Uncharacterized protein n=1 Tax=Paramecium sonneborni TaxID=65129 RepID=A0A8S1P3L0_9CILI|nr:unnamed protein product [Paramecium sonneborni]